MTYPTGDQFKRDLNVVLALKDDMARRGLITRTGYVLTIFPLEAGGGIKVDFSGAMTPKWKRQIRYWTRERTQSKRD